MNIVYQRRPAHRAAPGQRALLLLACGAQLLVVLDGLIVTVALPRMRDGLHLSAAGQQWIVSAYLLAVGGLLLVAARAADLFGHRRVLLCGIGVFTIASTIGGVAQNGLVLIAGRVGQGIGAAALATTSLSLLTLNFSGREHTRALSIWSAASASAGAVGLVVGGAITSAVGWRGVLLVNVPIGVILWVAARRTLPVCPVHARQQRRTTSQALRALLTRRAVVVANTVVAGIGAMMTATLFFLSLYQQRVLGDGPMRTGLVLLPMSTVLVLGALASRSLLPRFGARRLVAAGAAVASAGLAWLSTIPAHESYVAHVLGPTTLWAIGASITTMPAVALATAGLDPDLAGLASGLVNTARQIGGAVGLAVVSATAAAATRRSQSPDAIERTLHGYSTALLVASGGALLLALGTLCTAATRAGASQGRAGQREGHQGQPGDQDDGQEEALR